MAQQTKISAKSKKPTKEAKAAASSRGGARPGAGRKSGSGAYGEATVPMRVPGSIAAEVEQALDAFKAQVANAKALGQSVGELDLSSLTGMPLPAAGNAAGKPLDLGKALAIKNDSSFAWVASAGFESFGVQEGDIVVIDRAVKPGKDSVCLYWNDEVIELARGARAAGDQKPWGVAVALARRV